MITSLYRTYDILSMLVLYLWYYHHIFVVETLFQLIQGSRCHVEIIFNLVHGLTAAIGGVSAILSTSKAQIYIIPFLDIFQHSATCMTIKSSVIV